MYKLIYTIGLPGSGKSTWAREYQKENPNTVLVNKDELRAMLHNSVHSKGREDFVCMMRDFIITTALLKGHDVIVHDTNFHPSHPESFKKIVDLHNNSLLPKQPRVTLEVKDFSDVPLEECIRRDQKRPNYVGEKVIKKMYNQYLKPKPVKVEFKDGLPLAIICDLDGTLCLYGDANPYERDFTKDKPNLPVLEVLNNFKTGYNIIFVSGRKDIFRDQTVAWLSRYFTGDYKLYMRPTQPDGVQEPKDSILKEDIYKKYIRDFYNVVFVLDDRNQVVEFWRSQGLTVFQVAEGDF